jgi:transcriptional regulator with XRE-family HTH domain
MDPRVLAERLKETRLRLGLTLDQLAERSGVSRAMLSKLERAQASPTLVLLSRLMQSLGLTLSDLVERAGTADNRIVPTGAYAALDDDVTGIRRESLAPLVSAFGLDVIRVTIPPRRKTGMFRRARPGAFEVVHVIRGKIRVHEGDRVFDLQAGDTGTFRADVPIGSENIGPQTAQFLAIVDYHLPFQVLNLLATLDRSERTGES